MQPENSTWEVVSLISKLSDPSSSVVDTISGDIFQKRWAYAGLGIATLHLMIFLIVLSWCIFRQRRDHLKTVKSASNSLHFKDSVKLNSIRCSMPEKLISSGFGNVDKRAEGQCEKGREIVGSSVCCCCCCKYIPAGDPISPNSVPFGEENRPKVTQVSTHFNTFLEEAPNSPQHLERPHLNIASVSMPNSPATPPTETHPFKLQPPLMLQVRKAVELGQQRTNLMDSSCSAGDIHQSNRENDSCTTTYYNEEPSKAKNRSLIELRRGPRAALMLNLHSGASSSPSQLQKSLLGETIGVSAEGNRLLFAEHLQTSYATFERKSPRLVVSGEAVSVQPPTALAAIVVATTSLSPRPKTGEEPNRNADRAALRTASLPLTPADLEAKLGQGGEDCLYKEFWDIPMNFANKSDCPWIGVGQKNRYHEVLPHNDTRVVLSAINNDDITSYINANYIHGYQGRPRAFIATQGPMSHTINDFWRMVWHARVPAVVMLTKICERDKRSMCELYLPTSSDHAITTPMRADTVPGTNVVITTAKPAGSTDVSSRVGNVVLQSATSLPTPTVACWGEEFSRNCSPVGSQNTFGNIHVSVVAVTQKESYIERKLILKMDGEERRITHFWYVRWSDHSSPEATLESARGLLNLIEDMEACRHPNSSSSLPCTLAPSPIVNPPQTSPRSLSRQAAEEWSDADFDLRFPSGTDHRSASPTTAFDLFSLHESETSTVGPDSLTYRNSDPAPLSETVPEVGPVVVHCSAGVGRTGCFIALCVGCEQLRNENKVDVLGIVSRLRLDRGGMVENSEQYAFLHAALCMYNAIRTGRELPVLPTITNLSSQFSGPFR